MYIYILYIYIHTYMYIYILYIYVYIHIYIYIITSITYIYILLVFLQQVFLPIFILNRFVQSKRDCLLDVLRHNHLRTFHCISKSVVPILHKAHGNATHTKQLTYIRTSNIRS